MTFSSSLAFSEVTVAHLPDILAFVEDACQQAQVDEGLFFDLQLAVEEACANVIEHAYEGCGGALRVHFETRNGDVVITLHDQGKAFDPATTDPPDTSLPLQKRPAGGLGLHLMHRLMDDVRFSFAPDGNTLVMVKRDALAATPARAPEESHG